METSNLVFYDSWKKSYSTKLQDMTAEEWKQVRKALEGLGFKFKTPER